eukprot:7676807-Alexandrium_andersonii.AAC.1
MQLHARRASTLRMLPSKTAKSSLSRLSLRIKTQCRKPQPRYHPLTWGRTYGVRQRLTPCPCH